MAEKKLAQEQYYAPPEEMSGWEAFRVFLWNSETGQFLGRTGSSWAKILIFYVIFYAVLCGFFATIFTIFMHTLDGEKPKWLLESSLIGNNPGLGFRPMPSESNVESTLIYYKANDKGSVQTWVRSIDEFLKGYRKSGDGYEVPGAENRVPCTYDSHVLEENKVCDVPIDSWTPCTSEMNYNFERGGPCIFLKLNKIYGWRPDTYKNVSSLPKNMPNALKDRIRSLTNGKQYNMLDTIWVSCEGENPADIENVGEINYYPQQGFPAYYYPYKNTPGYLSPLVAVRFEKPKEGVLINIECKAWARNIHYDRYERRGSVHFELMVDKN